MLYCSFFILSDWQYTMKKINTDEMTWVANNLFQNPLQDKMLKFIAMFVPIPTPKKVKIAIGK